MNNGDNTNLITLIDNNIDEAGIGECSADRLSKRLSILQLLPIIPQVPLHPPLPPFPHLHCTPHTLVIRAPPVQISRDQHHRIIFTAAQVPVSIWSGTGADPCSEVLVFEWGSTPLAQTIYFTWRIHSLLITLLYAQRRVGNYLPIPVLEGVPQGQ